MDRPLPANLPAFLVEAKRRTYAGLDDEATISTPLLPESKQLEYSAGKLRFRDIYFGMSFFVGQEVVSDDGQAIWSMSYAGGLRPGISDRKLERWRPTRSFARRFLRSARSAPFEDRLLLTMQSILTSTLWREVWRTFMAPSRSICAAS